MAEQTAGRGMAGIGLGGILVIVGVIVAIVWSLWLGILIASTSSGRSCRTRPRRRLAAGLPREVSVERPVVAGARWAGVLVSPRSRTRG